MWNNGSKSGKCLSHELKSTSANLPRGSTLEEVGLIGYGAAEVSSLGGVSGDEISIDVFGMGKRSKLLND